MFDNQILSELARLDAVGEDYALCRLPGHEAAFFAGPDEFVAREFVNPYAVFRPQGNSDSVEEYLNGVSAVIADLASTGGKTVIARTIHGHTTRSLGIIADEVFEANPNAFCVLMRRGGEYWLAASPELLLDLDVSTGQFTTMSLAGTRRRGLTEDWDDKNRDEQDMVTRFITDTLNKASLIITDCDTTTLISNNIVHICTTIRGRGLHADEVDRLLEVLSPTPALCGMPRERALRHIARYEAEPRRLYGGYFGLRTKERVLYHVMLRCCRLTSDGRFTIYTGSGITRLSDPADELRETTLKASPMLTALTRS